VVVVVEVVVVVVVVVEVVVVVVVVWWLYNANFCCLPTYRLIRSRLSGVLYRNTQKHCKKTG